MNVKLTPEQEQIIKSQLEAGHSRTAEEVIGKALLALQQSSPRNVENGSQREAVREMLDFVEKNRVRLKGISVKDLIHEGHGL
jgi:Arc/MetJ-type ribon-helix-helix transcriptional regulator